MASGHVNRTNRPNTWLHRPATQREDFPCQLGGRGCKNWVGRRAATSALNIVSGLLIPAALRHKSRS